MHSLPSRTPRRAVVLLAAVLGLCLLSLVQGLVSGRLSVRGMVLTDDVHATWYGGACAQIAPAAAAGLAGTALTPNALDPAALDLTIANAFPGLAVECRVDLANTGLMPVRLLGVAVDNATGGAVATELLAGPGGAVIVPCTAAPAWGGTAAPASCHASQGVRIRVTDLALPNTRYRFAVRLCVAQESVVATPEMCFAGIPAPAANVAAITEAPLPPAPISQPAPSPVGSPVSASPPAPAPAPGSAPLSPPPDQGGPPAPATGAAADTPTPVVEVLPLTPPPATATPPAPPAATATPAPAVEVLPLAPALPTRTAPAPPPRLPNAGASSLATASDIGIGELSVMLGLAFAVALAIRIWVRRNIRQPEASSGQRPAASG